MIKMVRDGSYILVTKHSVNFFKSRGYSVVEEPVKTEVSEATSHTEPKKAKSK